MAEKKTSSAPSAVATKDATCKKDTACVKDTTHKKDLAHQKESKCALPEPPFPRPYEMNAQELGLWGEDLACEFLKRHDYHIVERNWRCSLGEVDIVAKNDFDVILIEVKTRVSRRDQEEIYPEEAIDEKKQRRYARIARCYEATHPGCLVDRFDAISIQVVAPQIARVRHILSAFDEVA